MPIVNREVWQCGRCGHEWLGRGSRPLCCAKCKSPRWDEGSIEAGKHEVAVIPGSPVRTDGIKYCICGHRMGQHVECKGACQGDRGDSCKSKCLKFQAR